MRKIHREKFLVLASLFLYISQLIRTIFLYCLLFHLALLGGHTRVKYPKRIIRLQLIVMFTSESIFNINVM